MKSKIITIVLLLVIVSTACNKDNPAPPALEPVAFNLPPKAEQVIRKLCDEAGTVFGKDVAQHVYRSVNIIQHYIRSWYD